MTICRGDRLGDLQFRGVAQHPGVANRFSAEGNRKRPMAKEYRIAYTDSPEDADFTVIGLGIRNYNEQQAGVDGHRRLCLFLHAPDDTVVGGLIGSTFFNWFSIELRRKGTLPL
jgi:hypothetical protein